MACPTPCRLPLDPVTGNPSERTGLLAGPDLSHTLGSYLQHSALGARVLDTDGQVWHWVHARNQLCLHIPFLSAVFWKIGLNFTSVNKMRRRNDRLTTQHD